MARQESLEDQTSTGSFLLAMYCSITLPSFDRILLPSSSPQRIAQVDFEGLDGPIDGMYMCSRTFEKPLGLYGLETMYLGDVNLSCSKIRNLRRRRSF
jgi:hypothetical protein